MQVGLWKPGPVVDTTFDVLLEAKHFWCSMAKASSASMTEHRSSFDEE
jgi:hypothetical protein